MNRAPQLDLRGAEIGGIFHLWPTRPRRPLAGPGAGDLLAGRLPHRRPGDLRSCGQRWPFAWGPGEAAAPSKSRGVFENNRARGGGRKRGRNWVSFRSLGGGPGPQGETPRGGQLAQYVTPYARASRLSCRFTAHPTRTGDGGDIGQYVAAHTRARGALEWNFWSFADEGSPHAREGRTLSPVTHV